MMKAWSRLQEYQQARTACPNGHEYTEENTIRYQGARRCRECKRRRARERYARRSHAVSVSEERPDRGGV